MFPSTACASLIHMHVLVPLVAALVPLLITPGLLSYFDVTPKIAILLFGASLSLLYRTENVRNLRALLSATAGRWFAALIAAEWLASVVATAFSSHRALSLNGGNWRRFGLIPETGLLLFTLLAAAWLAVDRRNIRTLLRASTASGALAALYGIAQYFGWDPLLPVKAYEVGESPFTIIRPPGTLGHADYFATWLVMIAFFGLALARLEQKRWRKTVARSVTILASFAIVLSGTRAALLGLLLGAIVLVSITRPRIHARGVSLAAACTAGLALFFFSPAGTKVRARVHWSLEDIRGGARLLLWRDSFRMATHRPGVGFGPETFITEFPRFESIELARAYPDFYHESPHNMFLDPFTSRGLPGLLVLLGFCALGGWAGGRGLKSGYPAAALLAAALAGTLISQQFAVFVVATALYFYLLLAILIALTIPEGAVPTGKLPAASRWTVPLGLAGSVLLAVFAIRLLVADGALAVAERRIESGNASGAAEAYRVVLRWQPAGAGTDLKYSREMQQLATRAAIVATRQAAGQQAIDAGIRATITSEDRQNAWYNLATLLAGDNDAAAVERSLRNAIAWAPHWFKPHWALAQLLEMTNRHSEALAEARTAEELDGGRDPEVAETSRKLQQRKERP